MFSWDMYFNHNRPFFFFFSFLLCCCFVLFCFYVSFTSFFLLKSCARFLFVAVFLWKKTFTDRTVSAACVCVCVRICVLTVIIQSNVVLLYSGTTSTTTLLDFHGQVGTHVKLPLLMPEQRHMLTILSVITLRLSIYLKRPILSMNGYSKDMRSAYPIGIRFNTVISFVMKNTWHLKHEDNELDWSKLCTDFTDLKTQFTSAVT